MILAKIPRRLYYGEFTGHARGLCVICYWNSKVLWWKIKFLETSYWIPFLVQIGYNAIKILGCYGCYIAIFMKACLGCGRRGSLKRNGIYNNVLFVRWMINVQTFDIYHILTFCMSNFLQNTHKIFIEYYCKFLLYLNKYLLAIFLCYVWVGIYLHSFHIWMYSDEYEIQEIELS